MDILRGTIDGMQGPYNINCSLLQKFIFFKSFSFHIDHFELKTDSQTKVCTDEIDQQNEERAECVGGTHGSIRARPCSI